MLINPRQFHDSWQSAINYVGAYEYGSPMTEIAKTTMADRKHRQDVFATTIVSYGNQETISNHEQSSQRAFTTLQASIGPHPTPGTCI